MKLYFLLQFDLLSFYMIKSVYFDYPTYKFFILIEYFLLLCKVFILSVNTIIRRKIL